MALFIKNAIIEELDIIDDDHGSVFLHPTFASGSGVQGTGREPTAKSITSIFNICNVNSLKKLKNCPVRLIFHSKILVAIGHYYENKWCYLPTGELVEIENIKNLTKQSEICYY